MLVYRPYHFNLGDSWATINLLSRMSEISGETIHLTTNSHGVDLKRRLGEILDVLDSPGKIILVDEAPTADLDGYDVWANIYYPTMITWRFNCRARTVVYQFDGLSSAESKNPPPADQERILAYLVARGFTPVRLGKEQSLDECVRLAASAALFVGCDSGMSHIVHSVGTPTYLLEYKLPIMTCHRGKQYVTCHGSSSFEAHVERYLDLLLSLSGEPRRKP